MILHKDNQMTQSVLRKSGLVAALALFLCAGAINAAGPVMTEAKAKDLIQQRTQIDACADPAFVFSSVQVASPLKQKAGGKTTDYYPVHARYAVTCRYGDEKMRAEVDLTLSYYQDPFGAWQAYGPNFDADQSWDNTQSDVRCRVQNLAHLTTDAAGKVTGSTPAKDQGFIGCTVAAKAAE